MKRGSLRAAGLSLGVLLAPLAGGPARAEPLTLGPDALDGVVAGAVVPGLAGAALLGSASTGRPADKAIEQAFRQFLASQPGRATSPRRGRSSVSASGKKTFKGENITKPHMEVLVVSGSATR